jgi:predicted nucleic acid-binding protein
MKYLIYLDNCCFNRPYDDHDNIMVFLEAEAKIHIQRLVLTGKLELVWSYILEFENFANPDKEISSVIHRWKKLASICISETENVINISNKIHSYGLGIKDSIHIASALEAKAEFFLTTDKQILKKADLLLPLKILNPINFIQMLEETLENR